MAEVAGQQVRYGQINREYGMKMFTMPPEDDGPIWMVNLMKYRQKADYADGRSSDISGREADDLYAPLGPLKAIGAQVVFVADVDTQFLNDSPKWDRIGVVKYPSRRAFLEMQNRPDFKELHHHKEAGMAETIVCGCLPMPVPALRVMVAAIFSRRHSAMNSSGPKCGNSGRPFSGSLKGLGIA